jgi:replicative DNA helicase
MTPIHPPEAPDAERAIIGALIIDSDAFAIVSETLRPEHFYTPRNRTIYQAMISMDADGQEIDSVSLTEHLRRTGKLDEVGSIAYLVGCMEENPGTWLAEQHAGILLEKHRLRNLLNYSFSIQAKIVAGESSQEILGVAEQGLDEIGVETIGNANLNREYAEEAESILNEQMGGYVQTGFYGIDKMMGGLKGVVILAARPSTGKSSLARDIIRRVTRKGKKVALLTPDQSGPDIYRLEASYRSGINLTRIKSRQYTLEEAELWKAELHKLRETLPLTTLIDDRPLTLPSLIARYRNAIRWGAELLVIDYMQLVEVPGLKANEEYSTVTAVSKAIKRLVRETGVPALVLAQLNRTVESRSNPKPVMSDLRSSGQIEQDADSIIFLHRPNKEELLDREPVKVIIEKQKDGPIGTVDVMFHREFSTFYDFGGLT